MNPVFGCPVFGCLLSIINIGEAKIMLQKHCSGEGRTDSYLYSGDLNKDVYGI